MDHTLPRKEIEGASRRGGCLVTAILLIVALFLVRFLASLAIDYEWWKEMGQVSTWIATWTYSYAPTLAATLIAFVILWISHARALKHAHTGLGEHPVYARLSTLALLLFSFVLALGALDSWTVVRYFGGRTLAHNPAEWHDPVFNRALAFYLFDLPFYRVLLALVLTIVAAAAILYWAVARIWQLRATVSDWSRIQSIDIGHFTLAGVLESVFVRLLSAVFLIALAIRCFLGRYSMALNEHGFMVGIDYVNEYFGLPLQWVLIVCCLLAAAAMIAQRAAIAMALLVGSFLLRAIVPSVVAAVYVRPNEISLEKPFIDRHIKATRAAYGIDSRTTEVEFQAKPEAAINVADNRQLLDNVRLWDMRAFRETVAQIQPLRPYVYSNVDVDRYTLGGEIRQVLVSPRELDLNGLGDARLRWINPHFIYTHGYGLVMAEANKITANGLPVLFIKDAPPVITTPGLTLNRPEIYYGEQDQDPVFVRTAQAEFNYPAGGQNVQTHYDGHGGFPISSLPMRTAAAISEGDWNILLTSYLTPESRMMIHRQVTDRLETLAGFLTWVPDPYMVLGKDGRLVWIVDGYMTSDVHPYSKSVEFEGMPSFNYIRNSVKATVDAYDGSVKLYVFDPGDPLISAYMNLFPALFQPASAMPEDIRAHVRYPEMIFRAQAEIYRTFHMRDPETFYNKSDAWDLAKFTTSQSGNPEPMPPNYVIATVPGQKKPEFLLMIPFTPRNRDNLIGLMMARCDGEHWGEKFVLLLSKQEIILGPMQVEARINQDQNISKDLTLWNQQGSQVLRGQMLVLPIGNTFLYVEPIYLQASQAKMPQLKKVAMAMGNTLIYTDTYEEALAQLGGMNPAEPAAQITATPLPGTAIPALQAAPPAGAPDPRIEQIRLHFHRYRDLTAQGKWEEAGKELEAIQGIVGK